MSINITVVDESGEAQEVEWKDNQTLLECLHKNQYPVLATCGGNASCATCHTSEPCVPPEEHALVPRSRTSRPAPARDVLQRRLVSWTMISG